MNKSFKNVLFYSILLLIFFIILEILSSFILLKRYSSKNLIIGLEKTNSHFLYLTSKVIKKSLKKIGFIEKKVQKPFYEKFFIEPENVIYDKDWKNFLENTFDDSIINVEEQLKTYNELLFNYRTPTIDYIYTNKLSKFNDYEKEVLYFDNYKRVSFKNKAPLDCWLFGGSTLFGDKLKNNQTLASQLNKDQNKYNFINYGLPGFNSNLQLRYLINLIKLKKNNLPACVIFFDGFNDSVDFLKSPLIHPIERSSDPEILFEARTNKKEIFDLEYIPFGEKFNSKIDNLMKYNLSELAKQTVGFKYFFRDEKVIFEENDVMIKLAAENYIDNGEIAEKVLIKKDRNIKFYHILQPNPFLDQEKNPFLRKEFFNSNLYKMTNYFYKYTKNNYPNKYIDLSNIIDQCEDYCYVDPGHYSKNYIGIISKNIIKELD